MNVRRCASRTASLLMSTALGALTVATAEAATPDPTQPVQSVTEVVVTGSRIPRINEKSSSPVAVVTGQEVKLQGVTHVEDLLNNLPQVNAGLNGAALGPTGTATVDLRGFGAFRTLVLIDGRRMNPGDPINPSADLNSVPAGLVKRVEVLTGGASSIYGSDAIAGVVNFVMDDNFNGVRLDAQYSLYQDSNSFDGLQALAKGNGFNPRSGAVFDGGTTDLTATAGTAFAGGAGHVTAYAGYRRTEAISGAKRDYSACHLMETANYFSCIRDDTTSPALFQTTAGDSLTLDPATGNTFRAYDNGRDGYNTSPFQYLQRPDTRYDAGFFSKYRFNDAAEAYLEAQFSQDHTVAQYEPAGTALNSFTINCANPLLSAAEAASLLCPGVGPTDTTQVVVGKRNVEGSPRLDDFRHTSYRTVLGVKGAIDKVWSYDVYGQYGITRSAERISNDVSLTKIGNALNVVSVGGVPTCQSVVDKSDPSCVPYNIFQVGGVTPAAVNYISEGGRQHGFAEQTVLSGALIGQLGRYGIKSPFSNEGVGVVGGAEYRIESIRNDPEAVFVNGDLASTSPQRAVSGTYNVYEFFGESHIPLVDDQPFIRKLSLDLSDRYANYNLQGPANSYKIGGEWSPIDDFRFRASYSQAIRAPNGHELFTATTIAKFQASDPCAGSTPVATLAQCQSSGVTPAEYGHITDTGNFNFLTGGNTHLKPETADTFTVGAVFTPAFIPRLSFSVDYWSIDVTHFVGQYAPNATLNNCVNAGDPVFCGLVQRDSTGSLSLGDGLTSGRVIATNLNTGSFQQRGIDLSGTYSFPLEDLKLGAVGRLSFNFVGSVALDSRIQPVPGGATIDCIGLYGPTCTGEGPTSPVPTWRHQLRVTWAAPKYLEVSLNWRHVGQLDAEASSGNPQLQNPTFPVDSKIAPHDYFDLAFSVDVTPKYNVRLGVDNLFDRTPPVVGANANPQILGGNMVASIYDTLGRYMFVGVTGSFRIWGVSWAQPGGATHPHGEASWRRGRAWAARTRKS